MSWSEPPSSPTPSGQPSEPPPSDPSPLAGGVIVAPPLPAFQPHESTTSTGETVDDTEVSSPGVLEGLLGNWNGEGLNVIWTPSQSAVTGNGHFLQLAPTVETQEFVLLPGLIPNRGLEQPDLFMSGVRYTQQITSHDKALHFEDGVWLNVPATTVPPVVASVARMASIPHGTTINAQGAVMDAVATLPDIPPAPITPFTIGDPSALFHFPEQDLSVETQFRTPDPAGHGFDQATVDDVNTFLRARAPEGISRVSVITVDSVGTSAMPGGGVANTAFLAPNALASEVQATIWLCTLQNQPAPSVMLYTQTVLLDFAGLSWPHITVGVLTRVVKS